LIINVYIDYTQIYFNKQILDILLFIAYNSVRYLKSAAMPKIAGRKLMRILVVDDSKKFRKAAGEGLTGHELVFANSYMTAMGIFNRIVREGVQSMCPVEPFDMVLADLLLPFALSNLEKLRRYEKTFDVAPSPCERKKLRGDWIRANRREPYGMNICFQAAKRGIRYIAVVSSNNGHSNSHPARALEDLCYDGNFSVTHSYQRFASADTMEMVSSDTARVDFRLMDKSRAESWSALFERMTKSD
jgi:CheY-like chemotaxis protein